ncbi:MAG: hypothetical protein JKY23_02465 [Nitrospinaceae bacterium]|nr:hypothetical protein [Nitrospinaceae bacterium]
MNKKVEKVIAERVLLSPLIVQGKGEIVDMPIGDVIGAKIKCWIIYVRIQYYMPLIIALERGVESIGVDQKKDSREDE